MNRAVDTLKIYLDFGTQQADHNEHGGTANQNTILLVAVICFAKILLIDIIFGRSGQIICLFIGFVYPAYRTTKAIESRHNGNDESDIIQWLMYWVVFAAFHLVEFFSDIILGWIPMYWLAKCIFLVACMSPINLASVIYKLVVLPAFKKNEVIIDNVVNECRDCLLDQCKKCVGITTNTTHPSITLLSPTPTSISAQKTELTNSPMRRKKRPAPPPPKVPNDDGE